MYQFSPAVEPLVEEICRDIVSTKSYFGIPCRCPEHQACQVTEKDNGLALSPHGHQVSSPEDVPMSLSSPEERQEIQNSDHRDVRRDILDSCNSLKDLLTSDFDEDTLSSYVPLLAGQEAQSNEEYEVMLAYLELDTLTIEGATRLGQTYLRLVENISQNRCASFVRSCLLPKMFETAQTNQRNFTKLLNSFLEQHEAAILNGLFLVMFKDDRFGCQQADLVVKTIISQGQQVKVQLISYLANLPTPWREAHVVVLQALIKAKVKLELDGPLLHKLCVKIEASAQDMAKTLTFGKLVFELTSQFGKKLTSESLNLLVQANTSHTTFMKKAVDGALKKLTSGR